MSMECTLERLARNARDEVGEKDAYNYGDQCHNQFANAFAKQLHRENFKFEREPVVDDDLNLKPDFVITGKAVVEIKAKEKGFGSSDRAQMRKYKEATGLPVFGINFGKDRKVEVIEI